MWMYFVSDRPEDDPRISPSELAYLKKTLEPNNDKKIVSHPWKEILKSPAVWAIFAIYFSEVWGHNTMVTQLPSLMRDVLGSKIQKTGFISALPYIATTVTMVISSYLADFLLSKKYLTTTQVVIKNILLLNCVCILHMKSRGY
ncbi:uncharacterized transporter slc-17.2-like [Aphidius gifuensis]|uniref:uncharacterized transporter slc-17.2-like n=1 Tax=Aphidius gifuensis TaxID=684658 RepID=UPI001CDCBE65|nr:uncharacterized transporter slc-17.2-like [Aphidius gifuensis]